MPRVCVTVELRRRSPRMGARRRPLARGELEAMVLNVLWDQDGWLTPGEMHAVVGARRRLAYTTIMTTLSRLWEKGRLDRRRRGRAYEYRSIMSRTEYAATRMTEFLDAAGDPRSALTHFVSAMDEREIAELRQIMRNRRRT